MLKRTHFAVTLLSVSLFAQTALAGVLLDRDHQASPPSFSADDVADAHKAAESLVTNRNDVLGLSSAPAVPGSATSSAGLAKSNPSTPPSSPAPVATDQNVTFTQASVGGQAKSLISTILNPADNTLSLYYYKPGTDEIDYIQVQAASGSFQTVTRTYYQNNRPDFRATYEVRPNGDLGDEVPGTRVGLNEIVISQVPESAVQGVVPGQSPAEPVSPPPSSGSSEGSEETETTYLTQVFASGETERLISTVLNPSDQTRTLFYYKQGTRDIDYIQTQAASGSLSTVTREYYNDQNRPAFRAVYNVQANGALGEEISRQNFNPDGTLGPVIQTNTPSSHTTFTTVSVNGQSLSVVNTITHAAEGTMRLHYYKPNSADINYVQTQAASGPLSTVTREYYNDQNRPAFRAVYNVQANGALGQEISRQNYNPDGTIGPVIPQTPTTPTASPLTESLLGTDEGILRAAFEHDMYLNLPGETDGGRFEYFSTLISNDDADLRAALTLAIAQVESNPALAEFRSLLPYVDRVVFIDHEQLGGHASLERSRNLGIAVISAQMVRGQNFAYQDPLDSAVNRILGTLLHEARHLKDMKEGRYPDFSSATGDRLVVLGAANEAPAYDVTWKLSRALGYQPYDYNRFKWVHHILSGANLQDPIFRTFGYDPEGLHQVEAGRPLMESNRVLRSVLLPAYFDGASDPEFESTIHSSIATQGLSGRYESVFVSR